MVISPWDLNNSNYLIFAIKAYDRPSCIPSEFQEDIKRIKYVKRLIKRFKNGGELKERLILNHIIILSNVFGAEFTTRVLFLRIDEEDYDVLKAFLVYLGYMPDHINSINGKVIISSNILMNMKVIESLRKI